MQCSGIILKITTDLHLVLILLCQVRPFATRRLVKEDNGRPVRRIYSTGTIGWQNSALDRRKFYDIKLRKSRQVIAKYSGNIVYSKKNKLRNNWKLNGSRRRLCQRIIDLYVRYIFQNTKQGLGNVSFSRRFAYVLNGWYHVKIRGHLIFPVPFCLKWRGCCQCEVKANEIQSI